MTNIAPEDIAIDIIQDTHQAVDADKRDGWDGLNTVEEINEAAHFLGEITESEYQRNKVALNKLVF